jgi:hypothetical protein
MTTPGLATGTDNDMAVPFYLIVAAVASLATVVATGKPRAVIANR